MLRFAEHAVNLRQDWQVFGHIEVARLVLAAYWLSSTIAHSDSSERVIKKKLYNMTTNQQAKY